MNIIGSSFPERRSSVRNQTLRSLVNDQEDSDEGESAHVAPERVARTPSTLIFGARSGLLLDPEHVRIGRQGTESSRKCPTAWRGDTRESTPALPVFRLMTAMCAAGLLGVNACCAVYDISVAFLHPRMYEVPISWRDQVSAGDKDEQ